MNKYIPDKTTVDAWLSNGGTEIVLEVIRRKGWTVDVLTGDDWIWFPDIVVVADRVQNTILINGAKSPYQQAMFAVAVVQNSHAVPDEPYKDFFEEHRRWKYPMFREHDKFYGCSISLHYSFCDNIRISSEVTVSLIRKVTHL